MAQYKNMFPVDLSGKNTPVLLRQMIAQANSSANKIGAIVKDGQEDVTLGGSCTGRVIRADGVTVLLDGTIEGNEAYIILDGNSYAVPGQIEICINWVNGDNVTTLLKAYGVVEQTQTENVIPSGSVINIDTIIEMIQAFTGGQYFKTDSTIITGDGTASVIADHDNVEPNTLYRLQLTTKMSWLPSDYPTNADIYYLIDITHNFNPDAGITEAILDYTLKPCWIRMKQPSGTFGGWLEIASRTFSTYDTIITGDGTASAIANHDNVQANMLYRLQLTTKMSWLPSDYPVNGRTFYMIDYTIPFGDYVSVTEIIYDENMQVRWSRNQQPGGTFGSWYSSIDGRMQILCTAGTNQIQGCVELATYIEHADVILLQGQHIITDFSGLGMSIGNDVRIIGTPGSSIEAHSSADNQYYSVFYAGNGNFELINVKINASRMRYCVHDDPPQDYAGTPARHIYRECDMYIDNTENTIWPNHQCIGGGLGQHTTIVIENCTFDAANPDSSLGLVSYHNNGEAGAEGLVFIKDSRFQKADGTARFGWYGNSQKITPCYVVNCLLGTDPVIRAETQTAPYENMALITWGNVKSGDDYVRKSAMDGKDWMKMKKISGVTSFDDFKTKLNTLMSGISSEQSIQLVLTVSTAFEGILTGTHSMTFHKLASTYYWGWGYMSGKLMTISRASSTWSVHLFNPDT